MIITGRVAYEFSKHDSATSTGRRDVQDFMAPEATYGTIISVESAPVRVTFDGRRPTAARGILLPPGVHLFPFANDIRFASSAAEPAAVSVVWLKGTITNETSE
jgi:hypothetical protein